MAFFSRIALVLLALMVADAALLRHEAKKGDKKCSSLQEEKHKTMYCTSFTCTECCDTWCKETCDDLKDAMEEDGCECEEDPEAHKKKSFCKDMKKDFKKDHKDDTFKMQFGRACSLGCKMCCKEGQELLQVDSVQRKQCQACMVTKGL
eukprot:gnl/TRDRNA2_/TRDRNA2_175488_c13_seq1.p2 gnl/TRDRNA2_/TRDRNA2_175488_c13~~gnl/TRDRNA2_/TRDRNA2_175488_c13_seq1.p2  ORF type:complete len:149 (-),score=56.21 gnl/TRDRNA2_/TRDRNA2_175488_c13_seq1:137-583(-)